MVKRIVGVLVVGVAVVFGLYPFMFGPGQEEQRERGLPQIVSTIAGFLPDDAEAIFARQGDSLQRLADADEVRLSFDGIQVLTDNPGVLPPDVEGLPVKALHPLRPSTVAGRPYKQALVLFEQQKGILQRLPGVEEVRLGHEGIYVVTENQTGIPATVGGLPVKIMPPMRPSTVAGRSYKDALAVYERNQAWLRELPDVEGVGLGAEGIHLFTENPSLIPPEVEGIPVRALPPMRRERIGGLPHEEAMVIFERNKETLQHLLGVQDVGLNTEQGLVVMTANPAAVPKMIEGLPITIMPPIKLPQPPQVVDLTSRPCPPGAFRVPGETRCRYPNSPSVEISSKSQLHSVLPIQQKDTLPFSDEIIPEPKLLPPPSGVIVLKPGKVREQAEACPEGFKEVDGYGSWRFCMDPQNLQEIPPMWSPPIAGIPFEEVWEIHQRHVQNLFQLPGVERVGLREDGIHIFTSNPQVVPKEVEGVPIIVHPPTGQKFGPAAHTLNTRVRPLHGAIAISQNPIGFGVLTGIALSQGHPWLIFPAHLVETCSVSPPCPQSATVPLNSCPHYPQVGQTVPVVVQPPSGSPELVGFTQRWTPLSGSASNDVAAAYMDSDTIEGNGSLSADPLVEIDTSTATPFSGTLDPPPPIGTRVTMRGALFTPHAIPLIVRELGAQRVGVQECSGNLYGLVNQVIYGKDPNSPYFVEVGDSGSPIFDGAGRLLSMMNFCTAASFEPNAPCGCIPDPGQTTCELEAGGTSAEMIQRALTFDQWYGGETVKNASFGIHRPGVTTNNWVMDRGDGVNNTCGSGVSSDLCYTFGGPPFLPVTGRWSAGGLVKLGLHYNGPGPGSGAWYLDLNGDVHFDCAVDLCYGFGGVDFVPVVGDWNGDGRAKIGVFYTGGGSGAGAWYLDYNGNGVFEGCVIDRCGIFGGPGYQGGAGDWNGDGKMEIGSFYAGTDLTDPNFGSWFLDWNGNFLFDGCAIDRCYPNAFGGPGDTAVVADWGGSGTGKIGVFRPSTVQWFLDRNGNGQFGGCADDRCFTFGQAGDLPISWNVAEVIGS